MIRDQYNPPTNIQPTCDCCFPAQTLVITGQRAYCPITERIHQTNAQNNNNGYTATGFIDVEPQVDFYPGRNRQRGEAVAFKINPAEERFGAE